MDSCLCRDTMRITITMQDFFAKIKGWVVAVVTPEIYTVLIIILVGFGSFGLGRRSAREENKTPIRILAPEEQTAPPSDNLTAAAVQGDRQAVQGVARIPRPSPNGLIVASKTGSKYYFPWCSGAKRIAEANKTWFSSEQEAQNAGLQRAANCK